MRKSPILHIWIALTFTMSGCEERTISSESVSVEQIHLSSETLWVERAFIKTAPGQAPSQSRFDSTSPDAFLMLPIEMVPSLSSMKVTNGPDSEISLVVASDNELWGELTESNGSSEIARLLTRVEESKVRPDLSALRGFEIREFRKDNLFYVLARTDGTTPVFLASCAEMLGKDGFGPDLCQRQFVSQNIYVSVGMSEVTASHADEVERDIGCLISVWQHPPTAGNKNRYASCTPVLP